MRVALSLVIGASALLLLLDGTAAAGAQVFRLQPGLLRTDGSVLPMLRAELEMESARLDVRGRLPREWAWGAMANLPFTRDADRNPESLRAAVSFGGQMSLYNPPSPPPDPQPGARYGEWNYGMVALDLRAGAEAPQRLGFADLLLGFGLGYEHDRYQELWFVPEARIGIDAVMCAACDVPSGTDATFTRMDGEVALTIPLDRAWLPDVMRPLWIRGEGRAFRSVGMPAAVEAAREVRGTWGSAELAYRFDSPAWLHEIAVRHVGGRVPIMEGRRTGWMLGLTLVP